MTILATSTISNTKVKTRWEEPYVSEAVNRALSTMPAGIHHGFVISPDGGTVVRLSQDTIKAESLVGVEDLSQGLTFVYSEPTEVTFDLVAEAGTRVWIFIHVDYSVGVATVSEYRVVDAAELANPWVSASVLLGTVRVPSAGAITQGDIDQGSARLAGLGGGERSRWVSVNRNPVWKSGLAGWQIPTGDPSAYFAWDTGVPRLGDVSGTQAPAETVEIRKGIPTGELVAGDYVYVRIRARSSTVTNGAFLTVELGSAFSGTIIDSNVAAAETFGFLYEWTGAETGTFSRLDIRADLLAGATATGYFWIEQVDIYLLQQSGSPQDVVEARSGFEEIAFGDPSVTAYGFLDFDQGGGNNKTFGFNRYDNGVTDTVLLSDATERVIAESMPSLVAADNLSVRTSFAMDKAFPRLVVSGGVVSTNSNPGATVDVTGAVLRNTETAPATDSSGRYKTVVAKTALAVPVSGGGGIDEFFIAYDASADDIVAFLSTDIGAHATDTLLSYGQYNNAGSAFLFHSSIADVIADLDRSLPITVGANGRFASLEGALWMLSVTSIPSTNLEIVLIDDISWDGVSAARQNVPIPAGTKIRGAGRKLISVTNLSDPMFDVVGSSDVIFENIDIEAISGFAAGAEIIVDSGTTFVGTLAFRDCNLRNTGGASFDTLLNLSPQEKGNGTPGVLTMDGCFLAGNVVLPSAGLTRATFNNCEFFVVSGAALQVDGEVEQLIVSGCRFHVANAASIGVDVNLGAATGDLNITIDNCDFNGDAADEGAAFTIDLNTAPVAVDGVIVLSNCVVRADGTGVGAQSVINGRFQISNCLFLVPLEIGGDSLHSESTVSGIAFDFGNYNHVAGTAQLYCLQVAATTSCAISGVKMYVPSSPSTFRALDVNSSQDIILSDLAITVDQGNAIDVVGCENIAITSFMLESLDAGDVDTGRTGINFGTSNVQMLAGSGSIRDFQDDRAIVGSATTTYVMLHGVMVRQDGATAGYTVAGSPNSVTDVIVFT